MSSLTIRLATPSDRDGIVALMQRAYRGDESRQGWTSEADLIDGERITPEAIDQVLQSPHHRLLIAKNGEGQLIGCADIEYLTETPDTCSFGKFAVEPSLQGGGVGELDLPRAAHGPHRQEPSPNPRAQSVARNHTLHFASDLSEVPLPRCILGPNVS
jgi:predicted N-acetyltransferase YhbS